MATLELDINAFKSPIPFSGNEYQADKKTLSFSLLKLFNHKPKPKPESPRESDIPKEYNCVDYKLFHVLRDFLQADSTISSRVAVDRVIAAFPYKYSDLRQLNSVCFEVAEQIPYHHPAHLKLVHFGYNKPRPKDPTAIANSFQERVKNFYACLREDVWDYHPDPGSDGEDPVRYVNYQAFVSLVNEGSFWNPSTGDALAIMEITFTEDHKKEASTVRDAWVMGAAQWILWGGQSLLKLHLNPRDEMVPTGILSKSELERIMNLKRITLHTWHIWTGEFRKTAESDEFGVECRDVAKRAADLMEVLEKAMLK
ncbi:hypothetical protein V502_02465 [Pseudogymnoascus sp. VKM F-4520 (FW-2644)]|nr:hypothetical protein V502_02465 [Pseudogymnoascus sp. VKM F-4520 (FW-2644)]